jgi:hypothetical protein
LAIRLTTRFNPILTDTLALTDNLACNGLGSDVDLAWTSLLLDSNPLLVN